MNRMEQRRSGAGLFLMELSAGLLIFALAAAVCSVVFVYAHRISGDSAALTQAVVIARNAAEAVRAGRGLPEAAYNEQGTPAEGADAYRLRARADMTDNGSTVVRLSVLNAEGQELYALYTVQGEDAS